jgi:hypothetical protein
MYRPSVNIHLSTRLESKQTERARVIGLVRRGFISESEGERELLQLQEEMATLEARRSALFERQQMAQELRNRLVEAESLLQQLRDAAERVDPDTRRALIEALVNRIAVYVDEENGKREARVVITYSFAAGCSLSANGRQLSNHIGCPGACSNGASQKTGTPIRGIA